MLTRYKPSKVFYGWWIVAACFLISLYTSGVVFYGFTAIFRPIAEEFGWSYVEVSLAASIRGMEAGLLAPVLGLIIDRWGARRLMFAGAVSTALGLLMMSQMRSLGMFYVASILMALGSSSAGISITTTVIGRWFHRNLGLATGVMICGHGASGVLVPLIVRLVALYEWRIAILILGVSMFVLIVPLTLVVRSRPEPYGYLPDGAESVSILNSSAIQPMPDEESVSAREALKSRTMWHIVFGLFPHFIAVGAVFPHVMPYLSSVGIPRSMSGLVATALPLISIAGRFGFGVLGDRLNKKLLSASALVGLAVSLLLFEFTTAATAWLLIFFVLLFGISYGGNLSMLGILLRDYFGSRSYGTIIGFAWGMLLLGNVVGPPFAGWFFDTWGRYTYAWLSQAGLLLIGAVIMSATPGVRKKK
mgnify:CR=1 FL=1